MDLERTIVFKIVCAPFIFNFIKKDWYNDLRSDSRSSSTRVIRSILNDTREITLVGGLKKIGDKKYLLTFLSGEGGSWKDTLSSPLKDIATIFINIYLYYLR